jgi:hypothetical protein
MKYTLLATMLFFAIPLAALADAPAMPAPKMAQLAGTWTCKTAAGSSATRVYTLAPDGSIHEHDGWQHPSGVHGAWDETFTYDASNNVWRAQQIGSNGWTFTASSPGFNGYTIEYAGVQLQGLNRVQVRERYTIDRPQHFTHVWEAYNGNTWVPTAYGDCSLVTTSSATTSTTP